MIDPHAHLNLSPLYDDYAGVIDRASRAGVTAMVVPAVDYPSSLLTIEVSEKYPAIFSAIGVHPSDARVFAEQEPALRSLLPHERVVAIGEIGLDYFHFGDLSEEAIQEEKVLQQAVFRDQLRWSKECNLPVIIHSRAAFADTIQILKEEKVKRAVLHCFVGSMEEAQAYLALGYYLSFTNIVTYRKNEALRAVLGSVPAGRFMIETDAPFLPPEGMRGQVCEPAMVIKVAECTAVARGITLEEVDAITTTNAKQFFTI